VVFAATTPGNAAASPAPVMKILTPFCLASLQYYSSSSGVLCAEITLDSCEMLNWVRMFAEWDIVSQSDFEPIMIATSILIT
jgi:hypothetical protein